MDLAGAGSSRRGERQSDELAGLHQIAALSASDVSATRVVREILRIVGDLLHAERVLLFTRDPVDADGDALTLRGPDGAVVCSLSTRQPGLIGRVFVGRSGDLDNELTDEEPGDEELRAATMVRQIAAVPLLLGDETLGVLAAANSTRGAFTEEDLRVLSILGDRVAVTLENARLAQLLEHQVRELEGLQRLSKLLTSSASIESVVADSISVVMEQIECEKMAILLYDAETDALVAHPPVVGITAEQLEQLQIAMSEPSMGGTVFRTNTGLFSNDAAHDAWVSPRFRKLLGIESLLVVPLTTGPKPLGILKAINSREGSFTEEDLQYAILLGRQVGAVLEANLARGRERSLMRELREADRTKSEFVSMLAHELKGPMTTVLGFSQTLQEQWDRLGEAKRNQVLEIIHKEVARLSRLVNDLLDVSRMEAGSLRYEVEPVPLQEVVESLLTVHTSLREDHAVVSRIPSDLPKVLTDRDRIRQVIINLLSNATRYSPGGTTIELAAGIVEEGDEHFVRLAVIDEGIGISPQDAARIFSKFAMLPKPGWTKKGTGLGLFITKGIVEAMGGRIWVESEVGRGSTFYVTMPLAKDEASN